MSKIVSRLPIDSVLPEIVARALAEPVVLLEAEPGAGKTTRVPAALLAAGLADVIVLEPRRIAARMAARRVAEEMGEGVGGTAGYQVRFEEVSSDRTRLWFATEGVLTRRLLSERGAGRARVLVLDEFHERRLETDLALALWRSLQRSRPDLRLLIMSATLNCEGLAKQLGCGSVVKASGSVFPVAVEYTPASSAPLEQQAAAAVGSVLNTGAGNVLVFLPGAAEIRRTIAACEPLAGAKGAIVLPLHGDLSPEEQDLAVAPGAQRKVICATNVAETSITIEGVEAVVDSGLARVLTHSQWSGLGRLQVEKISKSSAIQRAGRAGRTRPGVCIRLYPESDFVRRADAIVPEILRSDLAQTTLQLAAANLTWDDLEWLDQPASALREKACELLMRLGALDGERRITSLGRKMNALPVHPRLACFLHWAGKAGANIAAKLSEGRLRLPEDQRTSYPSDVDALLAAESSYAVKRLERQLAGATRGGELAFDPHAIEKALLRSFPDRVARRRGDMLLLSNGATAKLDRASAARSEFLVAVEVDDRADLTLVRWAAAIEPDWLMDAFPERISAHEEMTWNREAERVEQTNLLRYDALAIHESRGAPSDLQTAADMLAHKALEAGVGRFTDAAEVEGMLRRVRFAAQHGVTVDDHLLMNALLRICEGATSFTELRAAARDGGLIAVMQSMLPMRLLDEIAPSHIKLPSGRQARIEYHDDRPPSVASRLQDFFGMKETPAVARGAVPLVVQLLAPNQRPVQVTTDLVSFWKNLYPQVRRELSRRYPRHAWPEDPA